MLAKRPLARADAATGEKMFWNDWPPIMPDDPNNPEVLLSVRCDAEAAMIVGDLANHGIEAFATGGYTADFIAGAPGDVKILVKHADVERAQQALAESHQTTVDWENVDTSETPETPSDKD